MYKATDKICDLMSHEEDAIHVISRFGLKMGVGESSRSHTADEYVLASEIEEGVALYDRLLKELNNTL